MAIVRHNTYARIVTETEFLRLIEGYKPTVKEWQTIESIQTCVKAKVGLGTHIPIHFRAELNKSEESKITNEFKTSKHLQQFPPILKYEY
jgi:hypothetical protein